MSRHRTSSHMSDAESEALSDLSIGVDELLDAYAETAEPSNKIRAHAESADPSEHLQQMMLEQSSKLSDLDTLSDRRNARLFVDTRPEQEVSEPKTPNRKMTMVDGQSSPRDSMSPQPLRWRKHRVMGSGSTGSTVRGDPLQSPFSPSPPYSASPPLASPLPNSPSWRNDPGPTSPSSPILMSRPRHIPCAVPLLGFHDPPAPGRPNSIYSKEDRKSYLRATRYSRHTSAELPSASPGSDGSQHGDSPYGSPRTIALPRSLTERGPFLSGNFAYDPYTSPSHAQPPFASCENTPWYEPGDESVMTSRVRSRSAEHDESSRHGHPSCHDVNEESNDRYGKATVMDEYAEIAKGERRRVFSDEAAQEDVTSRGPFILSPARETFLPSPGEEEVQIVADPRDGYKSGILRNFPTQLRGMDVRASRGDGVRKARQGKGKVNSGLDSVSSERQADVPVNFLRHLYGMDHSLSRRGSVKQSRRRKIKVNFGLADVDMERQAELEKTWKLLHRPADEPVPSDESAEQAFARRMFLRHQRG